ncbi:MAG: FkbM family methyltransferase [Caulobacteraceae bacterium]
MLSKERVHRLISPIVYNDFVSLVPRRLQLQWPERQFLRRLLRTREIDCVFDVGANVGQYGSELRALGFRGLILSFEPDPAAFGKLSERCRGDARWRAYNNALGAEPGVRPFNLMTNSTYNSFRSPSLAEITINAVGNTVRETIDVELDTLDSIYPRLRDEFGFRSVHLKMDTQGYDVEVFKGGQETARAITSMQSEISVRRSYEGVPKWHELLAIYDEAGFDLVGLFPVNPQRPRVGDLDCFLVRRREAPADPS